MRAAALGLSAVAMLTAPAATAPVCSVFDNRPCTPSVCSVFDPEPCQPDYGFPFSQALRFNIQSREAQGRKPQKPLNTISDVYGALYGCWAPPPQAEARPGMEITVQLTFNRKGEVMGEPRFTYITPNTSPEHRAAYQRAVAAAISRCAPLPFTDGLGGALAGRPILIRFIDQRNQRGAGAPQ